MRSLFETARRGTTTDMLVRLITRFSRSTFCSCAPPKSADEIGPAFSLHLDGCIQHRLSGWQAAHRAWTFPLRWSSFQVFNNAVKRHSSFPFLHDVRFKGCCRIYLVANMTGLSQSCSASPWAQHRVQVGQAQQSTSVRCGRTPPTPGSNDQRSRSFPSNLGDVKLTGIRMTTQFASANQLGRCHKSVIGPYRRHTCVAIRNSESGRVLRSERDRPLLRYSLRRWHLQE